MPKQLIWILLGLGYALFIGFIGMHVGDEIYWSQAPFSEKLGATLGYSSPAIVLSLAATAVVHYWFRKPSSAIYVYFGSITFVYMVLFYGAARL